MGRPRKQAREPFWRSERNCWYVHLGTKTVRLDPDKGEAWRLWHVMMARKPEERVAPVARVGTVSAVEVIDRFLGWAEVNRARPTYEAYKQRLQPLIDSIPAALAADELKPYHLTAVMDAKATWGANRKSDFAVAVNRAFNWAVKQGIIDRNPVAHVERPAREVRELHVTPKDYAEVMAAVAEPNFRTLLEVAWETGARVQELRKLEARHYEPEHHRLVLLPKESKGKRQRRVIYLDEKAEAVIKSQVEKFPSGALLRNSEGAAWTKDAINCAFVRLKKKIGRKLHLGAWRKGYATEALKAGVDTNTLAHLLGHANGVMLSKVYARVQQDPEYMAEQARKAKRSS